MYLEFPVSQTVGQRKKGRKKTGGKIILDFFKKAERMWKHLFALDNDSSGTLKEAFRLQEMLYLHAGLE